MPQSNELLISLDSMPLSMDPRRCRDHSGHQVLSLLSMPLVDRESISRDSPVLIGAEAIERSNDGLRYVFHVRDELNWSDASPVTGFDYLKALESVRSDRGSPESFWLKNIRSASATPKQLKIELFQPDTGFASAMGYLALSPMREGGHVSCGAYRLLERTEDSILLAPNAPSSGAQTFPAVRFVRCKSPERNLSLFEQGELDLSSDTAFPLEEVARWRSSGSFKATSPGIFFALDFEGDLQGAEARALRLRIAGAVDRQELSASFGGLLPARSEFRTGLSKFFPGETFSGVENLQESVLRETPMLLAYDDYYPNRELSALLAAQLARAGVPVRLVEDSFESPSRNVHLRLRLIKGLLRHELSIYQGLVFSRVLAGFPSERRKYLELLVGNSCEPSTLSGLQAILNQTAAIVPLLEMPGYQLSRLRSEAGAPVLRSGHLLSRQSAAARSA